MWEAAYGEAICRQSLQIVQLFKMAVANIPARLVPFPDQRCVSSFSDFFCGITERCIPAPRVCAGHPDIASAVTGLSSLIFWLGRWRRSFQIGDLPRSFIKYPGLEIVHEGHRTETRVPYAWNPAVVHMIAVCAIFGVAARGAWQIEEDRAGNPVTAQTPD